MFVTSLKFGLSSIFWRLRCHKARQKRVFWRCSSATQHQCSHHWFQGASPANRFVKIGRRSGFWSGTGYLVGARLIMWNTSSHQIAVDHCTRNSLKTTKLVDSWKYLDSNQAFSAIIAGLMRTCDWNELLEHLGEEAGVVPSYEKNHFYVKDEKELPLGTVAVWLLSENHVRTNQPTKKVQGLAWEEHISSCSSITFRSWKVLYVFCPEASPIFQ